MRRSASNNSLRHPESGSTTSLVTDSSGTSVATPIAAAASSPTQKPLPEEPPEFSPNHMVQAANAALMERTPFAIDDVGDEDDEDDFDGEEADEVMDEVCTLLRTYLLALMGHAAGGCIPRST